MKDKTERKFWFNFSLYEIYDNGGTPRKILEHSSPFKDFRIVRKFIDFCKKMI